MKTFATAGSIVALAVAWPAHAQELAPEPGDAGLLEQQVGEDALVEDAGALEAEITAEGEPLLALDEWAYDPLYAEGWSVEEFLDAAVFGVTVEEIGSVENLLFDSEGEILAVIAEVGGFWDIGDTHVAVPWDEVDITMLGRSISIPVTEENVENYSIFGENVFLWDEELDAPTVVDDDLVTGPEVFKATDLIGDMAYLTGNERYGYVSDLVVQDGRLRAVVVDAAAYGTPGYYAYPYSPMGLGYGARGWRYGMGYGTEDVTAIETYEYGQMQMGAGEELDAN